MVFILNLVSANGPSNIIQQLNKEVELRYKASNYFKEKFGNIGGFNYDVFSKYQVPVYGKPHGDYKNIDGVMEPRFIGYADNGESVPTPVFPPDELGNYELCGLPWGI